MSSVETFEVRARVIAVVPEYHQAIAQSPDGQWQLAITRHTEGVSLYEVREGQDYLLTVKCRLYRVCRPGSSAQKRLRASQLQEQRGWMKIQLASDLHREFLAKRFLNERLITTHPAADVLVIAATLRPARTQ